jgi:hypothetical protein
MAFGEVNITIIGFAHNRHIGLQPIISQHDLVLVLSSLLREELHDNLFVVATFEDSFGFVTVKTAGHSKEPLGGFLPQISNNHRFFRHVLHRTVLKIKYIGEVTKVKKGTSCCVCQWRE